MVALVRRSNNGGLALRPFFRPLGLLEEVEAMARTALDTSLVPRLDMYEEGNQYVVKAEMPGVAKKDLDITLEEDALIIKAEKQDETETKPEGEGETGKTHYARERRFGRYYRYMTLPERVDAENISATLKKGLLEIRLPKAEAPESKKIEIKVK